MKHWISLGLTCLLALSLAGCNHQISDVSSQQTEQAGGGTAGTVSSSVLSPVNEDPWGLSLAVKDVTPIGLTLVVTQEGGSPNGTLQYGSSYILQMRSGSNWKDVPYTVEQDVVAWTDEAYLVAMGGQTENKLDWSFLYGNLPAGHYRIGKSIMDFQDTGDIDTQIYWAEFDLL